MSDGPGCGVSEHDDACLCDVVIARPLPPLGECLRDGVQDLWMGRTLCDVRGYSRPWDDGKILDYLVDLCAFYDAFHEQQRRGFEVGNLVEVPALEVPVDMPVMGRWKLIRETVLYCMDRFLAPLQDVVAQLGVRPQDVVDAMCTGKSGRFWDDVSITELDELMMARTVNYAEIARKMGVSADLVSGIRKYWAHRRTVLWATTDANPARAMFHDLCRNTDLGPTEIANMVNEAHGTSYRKSSVSKFRQRMREESVD